MSPDQIDEREDSHLRWSDLPADLLNIISQKITDVVDFVRFRCVCRSWRHAAKPSDFCPQLPWLLLPYDPNSSSRFFLSLSMRSVYTLDLPETVDHIICRPSNGSGWFLLVSKNFTFSLFNPLTRSLLPFASSSTLPQHFVKAGERIRFRGARITIETLESYFAFCCSFISPQSRNVVVAFMSLYHPTIYYHRSGDVAWSSLDYPSFRHLQHAYMAFFKDKLYVMDDRGQAVICDLLTQNQLMSVELHSRHLKLDTHPLLIPLPERLLQVSRKFRRSGVQNLDLICHELKETEGVEKWSWLPEVGDLTVFLTHGKQWGRKKALLCAVPAAPAYKSNHIYHISRPVTEDGRLCSKDVLTSEGEPHLSQRKSGYSPRWLGSLTWIIPRLG